MKLYYTQRLDSVLLSKLAAALGARLDNIHEELGIPWNQAQSRSMVGDTVMRNLWCMIPSGCQRARTDEVTLLAEDCCRHSEVGLAEEPSSWGTHTDVVDWRREERSLELSVTVYGRLAEWSWWGLSASKCRG